MISSKIHDYPQKLPYVLSIVWCHPPPKKKKMGTMEWPLLYQKKHPFLNHPPGDPSSFAAKSSSSKTTILLLEKRNGWATFWMVLTPSVFIMGFRPTPQSTGDFPGISETSTLSPVVWRSITFYKRSKRPILSVYWCMGPTHKGPHGGPLVRDTPSNVQTLVLGQFLAFTSPTKNGCLKATMRILTLGWRPERQWVNWSMLLGSTSYLL